MVSKNSRKTDESFGSSALLEWKVSIAPMPEVVSVIDPLIKILGGTDNEVEMYARKNYRNGELQSLRALGFEITSMPHLNQTSENVRKVKTVQVLMNSVFTQNPLFQEPIDSVAARMIHIGAEALYGAGRCQFEALKKVCLDIVAWFGDHLDKQMVILESPLGNCVPVAILRTLAERANLLHEIKVWNAPRNDRAHKGYTIEDSANAIKSEIGESSIVVYIDDAITGTRFVKCFDALNKVMKNRVLPIALLFQDASLASSQFNSLEKRTTKAKTTFGYQNTLVKIPALPVFKLDNGPPFKWDSPVIWGESDFTAGKRKVNLVFNLIELMSFVIEDLSEGGECIGLLETAWRQNTEGRQFRFAPGLTQNSINHLKNKVEWQGCLHSLSAMGKTKYPNDFTGNIDSLNQAELVERCEWLRDTFVEQAKNKILEHEAWFLWNAFYDTFSVMVPLEKFKPARDHIYSSCALRFNDTIRSYHEKLIDIIVNS